MSVPYSPYPPPQIPAHSSPAGLRAVSPAALPLAQRQPCVGRDTPPASYASPSGQATSPASAAGKKKHVCPICSKAFTTSGHLSRHARIHTGERNHRCPFPGCDTRCSRQDNLQQHYRIHLTPGSRRSSASARSQVLSGIRKRSKAPPASEESLDSPPSTPPALELAFVPPPYPPSEPSPPPLSAPPNVYPSAPEYVKRDSHDATTSSLYFDARGSPCQSFDADCPPAPEFISSPTGLPMGPSHGDPRDNLSGVEHEQYPPQRRVYSSGGVVMADTQSIAYGMYDTYAPPAHPPPHHVSSTRSSGASTRADAPLVQPQPRTHLSNFHDHPLHAIVQSSNPFSSPIPLSDSPSPVSSLSMSSEHSSEHSPSMYHKQNVSIPIPNGTTYALPPQVQRTQLQSGFAVTEHYRTSQLIPTETNYGRAVSAASWQNALSEARGMPTAHDAGVGFAL